MNEVLDISKIESGNLSLSLEPVGRCGRSSIRSASVRLNGTDTGAGIRPGQSRRLIATGVSRMLALIDERLTA